MSPPRPFRPTVTPLLIALLLAMSWLFAGPARSQTGSPPAEPAPGAALLDLYVLDVGQGDALLLRTSNNKVILVDAGPADAQAALLSQLAALEVDHVDLAVATHAHEDHIGNFSAVLDTLPVKRFIESGLPHTTETYRILLEKLVEKKIPTGVARQGQSFKVGEATVSVLGPREPLLKETRSDLNSNSVVLHVSLGQFSALLTGDSEAATEERLLEDNKQALRATVLKVAHHGGAHSSTPPFLKAVAPSLALISSGVGNTYGHPAPSALARLEKVGATVLRTDQLGTIHLRTDGAWIWVSQRRAAASPILPDAPPAETPIGVWPAGGGKGHLAPPPAAPTELAAAPSPPTIETAAQAQPSSPQAPAPSPAQSPETQPEGAPFMGSKSSEVFHLSSCANAARISPSNRVSYPSRDAAVGAGKRPAGCCRP